jgi:hypothetical protein
MFYHLLYIHLFRPFLKYNPSTSPLPTHVSPRKLCTQAASLISKLMRLYKRTYGLRNIAVYMVHSACTIHLLNLPGKLAKRDIIHGVKHLEEVAEDWLCARRTLSILSVLARKWKIELPEEASAVLARTDAKYGTFSTADVPSPKADATATPSSATANSPHLPQFHSPQKTQSQYYVPQESKYISTTASMGSASLLSTGLPTTTSIPPHAVSAISPIPSPRTNGVMNLPPENAIPQNTLYVPQQHYTTTDPGKSALSQLQSVSAMKSSAGSPSMLFGGVDALVESQNWWLKDQASLAVGFDNWGSIEGVDGTGMAGVGSNNFFVPSSGSGNLNGTGFGEDEWYV